MRTKKPILQIDKFAGAGQNGILYCEGFYPEVDNQKSVMGEGFTTYNLFNSATTGFTNLSTIYGSIALSTINSQSEIYNIYVNGDVTQRIFAYQEIGDIIKDGIIHTSLTSNACRYPDIIETAMGNILFPSERYIGRGVRFKATGGSTTTIIDITKNFTTIGYAANDTVTNLKTGIEYTISSISTTTNTNDTLNFTASGVNTTTADDEIIAWEDDRFDTNLTQSSWQQTQPYWVKQFKQYGDLYYFTNGNYIGKVLADESAVDADFKQLFPKHQAIAMSVNNSKILVSANFNGKGALLLWDGASDGWNNNLKIDTPVISLVEYGSGWVYISKGNVYYTDGYQIQKLYGLNQSRTITTYSLTPASHNGLIINEGFLYCANYSTDYNLIESGIYAIDLGNVNNGFTIIKPKVTTRVNGIPNSIFLNNIFSGSSSIEIGGSGFVSYILSSQANSAYQDKSMLLMVSLPDIMKVNGIGLNLSRYIKNYNNDTSALKSRSIQVSVGDGNRGLIDLATTINLGTPTTTFIVNGEYYLNNKVGDQIYVSDKGDATFGERTFITEITTPGTSTETWQTSPALSGTHSDNITLKMIRTKLFGKKTVSYNELKDEIFFFTQDALMTNKIFIEVVFFGQANALALNINEINVYGD
jgi:hypothetical protein